MPTPIVHLLYHWRCAPVFTTTHEPRARHDRHTNPPVSSSALVTPLPCPPAAPSGNNTQLTHSLNLCLSLCLSVRPSVRRLFVYLRLPRIYLDLHTRQRGCLFCVLNTQPNAFHTSWGKASTVRRGEAEAKRRCCWVLCKRFSCWTTIASERASGPPQPQAPHYCCLPACHPPSSRSALRPSSCKHAFRKAKNLRGLATYFVNSDTTLEEPLAFTSNDPNDISPPTTNNL